MTDPSGENLEQRICSIALALGFDLAGVAPVEPGSDTERLREWVARGYAGSMGWMAARLEERVDPRRVLEGARSALVVGLACDDGCERPPPALRVARYARGDDYHEVLLDRLRAVAAAIEVACGRSVRAKAYVDTGPVAERALAARAGLGWIGKNACLIHPRLGSHVLLGVLLLDLDLAPGTPEPDHCGTCRACLDACPTDAFAAPYVLDARRCIAYTTIEDPGPIPPELRAAHGDRVFGCDVCQDVCPWNRRRARPALSDPLGLHERLAAPREAWCEGTLGWLLAVSEDELTVVTRHSAVRRARWRGLVRNALVAAGNAGDRAL
ncbi:MAG: tRNA epoxyqueuosine(34) reductase QueG, partial [Myxococcales bacterium]|nr:tRNA epoxyqueuosine(34) reductase QueG [Myxococcales bacterium]